MLDVLGVPKGKVVLIMTPNHIFVPVAYLGIVGAGRVFSGVNPIYTINEVEFQMRNTEAELILVHPSLLETAVAAAGKVGLGRERILLFSDEECEARDGVRDWRAVDVPGAEGYRWDEMRSSAKTTPATINYSSGTTGLPKGVVVSHHNIVANSEQTIVMRDAEQPYKASSRPEERWIGFLPLYHAYGRFLNVYPDEYLR
jgi:4-coumarate--CoA ligase